MTTKQPQTEIKQDYLTPEQIQEIKNSQSRFRRDKFMKINGRPECF